MKYSLPQPFHLFGYRLTARRLIPNLKWEAERVKGGEKRVSRRNYPRGLGVEQDGRGGAWSFDPSGLRSADPIQPFGLWKPQLQRRLSSCPDGPLGRGSLPLHLQESRADSSEHVGSTLPLMLAARLQRNANSAVSGALSSTRSNALAAPVGRRFPCSQFRIVSCGTSMRWANSY